jgi:hypothetical protein
MPESGTALEVTSILGTESRRGRIDPPPSHLGLSNRNALSLLPVTWVRTGRHPPKLGGSEAVPTKKKIKNSQLFPGEGWTLKAAGAERF